MEKEINNKQFSKTIFMKINGNRISDICIRTVEAIVNRNYVEFDKCLKNKQFNINERFDTIYHVMENYLGLACEFNNSYAASKLLNYKGIVLTSKDKQRLLESLTFFGQYVFLYKVIKKLEDKNISIFKYLDALMSLNYEKIEGESRKLIK